MMSERLTTSTQESKPHDFRKGPDLTLFRLADGTYVYAYCLPDGTLHLTPIIEEDAKHEPSKPIHNKHRRKIYIPNEDNVW